MMSEQKRPRHLHRRSRDRIGARGGRHVRAVLRRRCVQYRDLSGARRHRRGLRHRARRRSLFRQRGGARRGGRRIVKSHAARARPVAGFVLDRNRHRRRTAPCARWGEGAPARELFELPDWMRVAESLTAARLIYFSGITLSLYSNNGLGRLFCRARSGAAAGRQGGVRRQFSAARLERRSAAHPRRLHRGAQARRHRAAGLR